MFSAMNSENKEKEGNGACRRRRWSPEEKLALVQQTYQIGQSVSSVARQAGVAASLLFQWRKAYADGSLVAVAANESVVPASEMKEALKRIKQLGTSKNPRPRP